MTEKKRFIDAYQDTIAALRAELDAAKAANAALEARDKEARDALESVHTLLDSAGIDRRYVAYRVNSLINQRDEARRGFRLLTGIINKVAPHISPAYMNNTITAWDAERPAPDTNRDAGDESGV